MSLHQLAHHIQSAGRGDDKILVHMTPKEVGGLQALAMAHGGSLTINPETGLPEAGFLSSLLPMVAGLALGPAGLGLTAMQAGLATAAVGTAATGSLGKGLMMGLGAYGGAGLGAGLKAMATPSVMTPAIPNAGVVTGPTTSTLGGSNIFAKVGAENLTTSADDILAQAAKTPNIAPQSLAFKPYVTPGMTSSTLNQSLLNPNINFANTIPKVAPAPSVVTAPLAAPAPAPVAAPAPVQIADLSRPTSAIAGPAPLQPSVAPPSNAVAQGMSELGRGAKTSFSSLDGLKGLYSATEAAAPYATYAGLGSMALGSYYDKLDKAKGPPKTDTGMIRPYSYERTQVPGAYDMGAPMYAETPGSSAERDYFIEKYTALTPYKAPGPEYAAEGGIMGYAVGGPVETMSALNAVGANTAYPQAGLQTAMYSNPAMQRPIDTPVISQGYDTPTDPYTGEMKFAKGGVASTTGDYKYDYNPQTMQFTQTAAPTYGSSLGGGPFGKLGSAVLGALEKFTGKERPPIPSAGTVTGGMVQSPAVPTIAAQPAYTPPPVPAYQTPEQQLGLEGFYPMMEKRLAALGASQGYAGGGLSHLGDYSDGGRLLKGPGDGVSDSIPAVIGNRQPARLADGEFVVPARIVSELGNGSTEAGARKLYAMMDRVQKARRKTVGKNKVAANTRSEKYLPA